MKTKLVDFDVAKAKDGAKVVTRDGERARIICYDRVNDTDVKCPIVALIMGKIMKCECVQYYNIKGKWNGYQEKSCKDLMIDESEFEDGDIIAFGSLKDVPFLGIFKSYSVGELRGEYGIIPHVHLFNKNLFYDDSLCTIENLRLATEEEKQKLFEALAKEGKRWNVEKKCIEELPKATHQLKAFDKVLVRDSGFEKWEADIFRKYSDVTNGKYHRCFYSSWKLCIPYEGNESLLGTTGEPSN